MKPSKDVAKHQKCFLCEKSVVAMGEIAYMLRDTLWKKVVTRIVGPVVCAKSSRVQFLCIDCVEKTIGRYLDVHDFAQLAVNLPEFGRKSDKLLDRLGEFDYYHRTAATRAREEIHACNDAVKAHLAKFKV